MSTELTTIESSSDDLKDVSVTSYSGGEDGRCLQLTQMNSFDGDFVQMTEQQVRQAIAVMQEWLDGTGVKSDEDLNKVRETGL